MARLCCSADSQYDFDNLVLELAPHELPPPAELPPLQGGTGAVGQVDHARSYFNQGDHRFVHGVRVVWCLGGGRSTYTVVPGSHKSTAETPAAVRSGEADDALASLGLLQQPDLQPGDALIIPIATLQAFRPPADGAEAARLVCCELRSNRSRLSDPECAPHPIQPPDSPAPQASGPCSPGFVGTRYDFSQPDDPWMEVLSPVERTVLGERNRFPPSLSTAACRCR